MRRLLLGSYALARGKQMQGQGSKSPARPSGADQDAVFETQFMQLFQGEKYADKHSTDYTKTMACSRLAEQSAKDRRAAQAFGATVRGSGRFEAAQGLPTLTRFRDFEDERRLSASDIAKEQRQR